MPEHTDFLSNRLFADVAVSQVSGLHKDLQKINIGIYSY